MKFSWPKFIDHTVNIYKEKSGKVIRAKRELSIPKGTKIRMREIDRDIYGSIDAIDFVNDQASACVITDYKLKGVPDLKKCRHGYEPQLAIYAKVVDKMKLASLENIICGYWSIKKAAWTKHSSGNSASHAGLTSSRGHNITDMINNMEAVWEWRENSVLSETRYYADPSDCGFCDFKDMCRLNDPMHRDRIEHQKKLNDFVKER